MQELEQTTLADCVAAFIAEKNTPAVFQLSGGMIAFLIDAIGRLGKTPIINTRHEQAAGFAAEGSARVTSIPGFAFGTSGPGATNLLTPIASSYFDSVPVVYITGQVNQSELRNNSEQRQNGFQELDICEMASTITKKVYRPQTVAEVMDALNDGWLLTQQDRQGPVLIDIPINLQQQNFRHVLFQVEKKSSKFLLEDKKKSKFLDLLIAAKYPLILIGGGVRLSKASTIVSKFINQSGIPYVSSLLGLDSVLQDSDKYLGFIGSYGNRWANSALRDADLLIVLGSRLDVRQTGNDIPKFKRGKKIIRIDIDAHELNGRVVADLSIMSDIKDFVLEIMDLEIKFNTEAYISDIREIERLHPQELEQTFELNLNPNKIMKVLSEVFVNASGFVIDVGQHQMWAAQSIRLRSGQRFLTSGGLGSMGFALPASIGAAVAAKGKWVAVLGDGCLQLSSAELQTIIHYKLPIAVCVINNSQHGMVAQFQDENMDGRLIGTRDGFSNPNFQKLAKAYGFATVYKICSEAELISLEELLINWEEGPIFIEFIVDPRAKALPKMSPES
jgi:acetolactate synthase-1/2/3 large subunit